MRFYQATRFLFPRSFELRLLAICFLAVHVPLIVCVAVSAATGHWNSHTLLLVLGATLVGTIAGVAAIHALLSPLTQATAMLRHVQKGERVEGVPEGGNDLVGRLLRGVTQAASEAADRSDRLAFAAERDHLTGILNRRGFFASARKVLTGRRQAVLGLVDLDHFKAINDHLGHAAGDVLLHAFAQRMVDVFRQTDICARWGGEEFAVLLPGANIEQARAAVERLRSSIARHPLPNAGVTFSCGLASLHHIDELHDIATQADKALYIAKHEGRDRTQIADQS
jgi:diguanylate cyclase (GGDEF)-like protein